MAGGLGLVHCRRRALSWMAKEFLGVEMDKEQQLSDWQEKELTKEQIQYSAIDSWVASSIVEVMFRRYRGQVGQVSHMIETDRAMGGPYIWPKRMLIKSYNNTGQGCDRVL